MKINRFLIAILVMVFVQTKAQIITNSPPNNQPTQSVSSASLERNGVFIEPLLGYGSSDIDNTTMTYNWVGADNEKLGCGIGYMINDHFGVSSGAYLQQYSAVSSAGGSEGVLFSADTGVSGSIKYTFTYLEVPLLLRYISSHDNKFGFFAEAGFNVGFLLSSSESGNLSETVTTYTFTTSTPYFESSTSDYYANVNSSSPGASSINLSAHLALGVLIPLSQKCSLIIDGAIDQGLTNVGNGSGDAVSFGNGANYYYYGGNFSPVSHNYGSFVSGKIEARLNIKISGHPSANKAQ